MFGRSDRLTTQLHLAPRLGMSGAMPVLPLYAFVVQCPALGLYVRRRPLHAEPKIHVDGFLFNFIFQFFVAFNAITADRDLNTLRTGDVDLRF